MRLYAISSWRLRLWLASCLLSRVVLLFRHEQLSDVDVKPEDRASNSTGTVFFEAYRVSNDEGAHNDTTVKD